MHRVAPREAVGAGRKECRGDKEERRGHHLPDEELLKGEVAVDKRYIEREVRPKQQISCNQIPMIMPLAHTEQGAIFRPEFIKGY